MAHGDFDYRVSGGAGRDDRIRDPADRRSLQFVGGLAEGTETVIAYVPFYLVPG